METPEEITKNYNKSHLLMLEQSQTMQEHFSADKADFAKFTMFLDPYAANWQTAIDVADAMPDDEAVRDEIKLLTQGLDSEMTNANNFYGSLMVYVKQAYPKDAAILQLFGEDRHREVRDNQLKMIELMELVAAKANTQPYKAALILKGFLQADINNLKTIELNLRGKNKAQESAISNRPFATQTRQRALNAVWDINVQVNEAAQSVYKDNYAKLHFYLLYPETGGGTPPLPSSISLFILLTDADRTIAFDYTGNIFATGDMLTQTWETGIFNTVVLSNGIHGVLQWTYTTSGEKNPILTGNIDTIGAMDISNARISRCIPVGSNKVKNLNAWNNNFDEPSTNGVLIWLDANAELGGTVTLAGGTSAAPTGDGIIAKNSLIAKGWTVTTN